MTTQAVATAKGVAVVLKTWEQVILNFTIFFIKLL